MFNFELVKSPSKYPISTSNLFFAIIINKKATII